ncbi:Alpha/Beta hydrolase protein [Sparassis latifolia]|uniref:Alpha/beta-hydrolase n=1 Tax=Sparassis crispa TaxID=139825 RepID=A0A401GMB0_9APHY|nr:alpha/beta-hydrolase [Sparassis crispa]GBE83322.1 alpha/beta-hydrolase [Sparassis crispa]
MTSSQQFTRQTVKVPSAEADVNLEVWLYLPAQHGDGPFPVVVAGHGLSLVKEAGFAAFGESWASAGWASLVLDCRGFGGSGGQRNFCCIARQVEDYRSVIAWAKTGEMQSLFQKDRIVVMGSAMSGLCVAELALNALEEGIAGAMAHCPILDGYGTAMALPPNFKLLFMVFLDYIGGKLGFSPLYVNVVAKPGEPAICNTPSCLPGFVSMYEQSDTPFSERANIVPGRLMVEIMSSRLDLSGIKCPMLVVMPENDDLIAPSVSREAIAKARGKIQSVVVPGGHFDVMKGGVGFEGNIKAQLEFLRSLVL